MSSYGHAYLTSYGWTGTGTGLRNGAIDKPLAIPPKKNLSGLGKDRDEAFPFWDHLFTAASKAITIRISSDNEDDDDTDGPHVARQDPSSHTDPIRRTTTGIISNRRPISGTPASTSSSPTDANVPNTGTGAAGRLSLLATAKREAAKRGLYSRFFRGPVLGPDDDPPVSTASDVAPSSPESSSLSSTPAREHGEQDSIAAETKKSKKRKSEDNAETKEERRERKRLKKERKAARTAKKAEKILAREKAKQKRNRLDVTDRKDNETRSEETEISSDPRKARKQALKSLAGDDLERAKCTGKKLEGELAPTNNGQQDTSRRPSTYVDASDALNIVLTTKKKRGKRKDTLP